MRILIFQHIACEHPGTIRNFMGFCLGHQLLAEAPGGTVEAADRPEIGVMTVELTDAGRDSPFLMDVPQRIPCFQWHSAEVSRAPDGAVILASSPACTINAMSWGVRAFSIQFHVEITPRTVAEWGQVPAYATILEQALGDGALARLEEDTGKQMARFNDISKRLHTNFMSIVRRA